MLQEVMVCTGLSKRPGKHCLRQEMMRAGGSPLKQKRKGSLLSQECAAYSSDSVVRASRHECEEEDG